MDPGFFADPDFTCVFRRFFHGSESRFPGSDPDFFAYPDMDSGKKIPIRIRNTGILHIIRMSVSVKLRVLHEKM